MQFQSLVSRLRLMSKLGQLARDQRGNVALLTGLLALPVVASAGYAIDYARAVGYRTTLDAAASTAALAAIDSARAMIAGNVNITADAVNAAAAARGLQAFLARAPSQTLVTYTDPLIAVTRVGNTVSAQVTYSASVPTTLTNLIGLKSLSVGGAMASTGNLLETPDSNMLIEENFDKFTGAIEIGDARVMQTYNNWVATGSGLEIGGRNFYGVAAPPSGATYMAELDAHSNVSISKKIYVSAGSYELRYFYHSRIGYTTYDPAWLCSTRTQDVDWATDTTGAWGVQTNRVGVYLELALSENPPPVYSAATHNMIDVCAYSGGNWIERSVKIVMNTPGYYWLAFQAEGVSDRHGGLLTNIRLCRNACAGSALENFPWTANQLLFKDDFTGNSFPALRAPEAPADSVAGRYGTWNNGTLDNSGENTGWPRLPTGWTTAPFNQMDFDVSIPGPLGGSGLDIDATMGNRAISRRFMLVPGYYRVQWSYASRMAFDEFGQDVLCGFPVSNSVSGRLAGQGMGNANPLLMPYADAGRRPINRDTNVVSVYMDADRLVSHPTHGPEFYAPVTYKNPDDSSATLPQLPQQQLDHCGYAANWQTRSINVKIIKPGLYWLTFRGEGESDNVGGQLANFRMYGVGSLQMASPPSNPVTIATAGPAVGATIMMSGFQFQSQ
ncbi:MAG: hypothetical protein JWN93_1067 [Hyphomicrobiales bacterium]|nr:hypothetical protein [Hyphomicrobiales bacterium]